ncbi:MAG: hypothetical protein U9R68_01625, partial [Planctomycetota bacterium]|nr:hypothetical protein [Planctomycetota bacterium]
PWVYDVSDIALPSAKDIGEIKDQKKRIEAVQKDAETFLKAVRNHLKAPDYAAVWYTPAQVLVFGDAKRHERAAKLFDDLADPKAALEGNLADLHKTTAARAEARKDVLAKLQEAREKGRLLASLAEYSWRLLAEAAAGNLDDEALTHLTVAWRQDEIKDLAKNEAAAPVLLRSAWALTGASDNLKGNALVAKLAHRARVQSEPARRRVMETLEKSPQHVQAGVGLLYAALTTRNDVMDIHNEASRLLVQGDAAKLPPPVAALRTLAAALLKPADEADAKALGKLTLTGASGVRGPDMVVLTALACRRAGGEAWRTFRAEARPILGGQPLPGSVVVLVGRLTRPDLRLASAG